jgi:hypothetical protein
VPANKPGRSCLRVEVASSRLWCCNHYQTFISCGSTGWRILRLLPILCVSNLIRQYIVFLIRTHGGALSAQLRGYLQLNCVMLT